MRSSTIEVVVAASHSVSSLVSRDLLTVCRSSFLLDNNNSTELLKMAEEGHKVTLNVYDLSQGLARQLSTTFLGKAIEAIWHTGVVVYGNEYYFGGGIQNASAGTTPYGTPIRVVDLGVTHEIGPRYTAEKYSLLTHNCNNFSNEVAQFLVGASIPDYILNLPNEVMSSPMGAVILPMIQQLETTMRAGAVPQAPQFRPSTAAPVKKSTGIENKEFPSKTTPEAKCVSSEGQEEPKKNVGSPAGGAQGESSRKIVRDPLGNARSKLQEEISTEFAALMASGTLRASEAAALATKRVMQRYGHMNAAQS
ncbi:unnamed protein product [Fraxinus pennsylvanica]|uniref:PPPDE domain-containing protein n=1 Tax=Fraxinus pennsylvanica TaxID=56036 RepID=A0AAD1ZRX6_9LAMI|nr:unnamed protein product [Fraxinus pennsylvanica]